MGDGTTQTVTVQDESPDHDQSNPLNENCLYLGIDLENNREYYSCRSEIDITNLGSADADALEWQEETFPLANTLSYILLDSQTELMPDDAYDVYKVVVETFRPIDPEHGNGNTGIQRVDEVGYTISQEWKDALVLEWAMNGVRANTESSNTESSNTESANT
jgi:hypothetical protein